MRTVELQVVDEDPVKQLVVLVVPEHRVLQERKGDAVGD